MKKCKHCNEEKDEEAFGVSHRVGDVVYYRNVCRDCRNVQIKNPGVIEKPNTKACTNCKIEKEINTENFSKYTSKGNTYYRSTCNECRKKLEADRRANNPEKKREQNKKYYREHQVST